MKTEGTWAQESWKKKKVTKPNDDKNHIKLYWKMWREYKSS